MNPRHIALLVTKEFTQLRRDPLLLRVILMMPVMYLVMFGYVVAADVRHLPTAYVDLDHSVSSRGLEGALAATGYFDIVAHPAGENDLRALLDSGTVRVAVVVPAGTQAALDAGRSAPVAIVVDGSDSSTAGIGTGYALATVGRFNAQRLEAAGLSTTPAVDARVQVLYDPSLTALHTMLPGLMVVILMLSLMVVMSQAVVRERESGTLEQLFVTPIGRAEYLVGKVLPYTLIAIVQSVLVGTISILWFGMPFRGSLWVVVAGLGLFLLVAVGLGLLVSLLSRTRAQAQQTVMLIMIPAMLLSGFIFPVESMPLPVQPLSYAIPLTYALDILRAAVVKGAGLADLVVPFAALAGWVIVVFGSAVLMTRKRLAE